MKDLSFIPMLSLQLFAEGGAGAAGDGGPAQGTGVTGAAAVSQTKGEKGNPLANVRYGKQGESAPAAEVQTEPQAQPTEAPADLEAEFEDLINGKFKSQFQSRTQSIIQQRLKGSNETVEKFNTLSPVLDLLGKKYGVDTKDIKALAAAIEADDDLYADEALEEGTTPKELRKRMVLQRQNQQLMDQLNQRQQQEHADRQMAEWERQAAQARQTYPNLDLSVEAQNPQFRQLLGAGVDVGTAYMVIHKDDVIAGAMQHTAKKVAEKLTNNIIANGKRPAENGMSSQSAAVTKSDPSKFTREDRREILRRVARGERIEL